MYNKRHTPQIENRLLATYIADNANFEEACLTGNAAQIISIIEMEMEKNNLYTKGAKKLREDIIRLLRHQERVPTYVGQDVLMFVWNSRLAGTGFAVT